MRKWLDRHQLAHPPIPAALAADIQDLGENFFGTRDDVFGVYADPTLMLRADGREYLLLEYAGHGVNSYALSYFLVHGGLAAYLQIGLGGSLMDNDLQRRRIADAFTELAHLVEATAGRSERVTVFAWDMVGKVGWVKPGEILADAWKNAHPRDPAEAIAEARAWISGSGSPGA
jgi:hypothetical protein